MRFNGSSILSNGDMSLASVSASVVDLSQMEIGAIQAVWSGAPVGNIFLQISCDLAQHGVDVINWSTYTGSNQVINGAGSWVWNLNNLGFRWCRSIYVSTSGAGSLNVVLNAKGA